LSSFNLFKIKTEFVLYSAIWRFARHPSDFAVTL